VDLFHSVQLAVKMTADVRRRVVSANTAGGAGQQTLSTRSSGCLAGTWRTCAALRSKIIETLAQARCGPGRRALRSHRPPDGDRPGRLALVAEAGLSCPKRSESSMLAIAGTVLQDRIVAQV